MGLLEGAGSQRQFLHSRCNVIRINPMPAGFEEYDWKNGWPLISGRQLVIFGKGIQKK
jgi:hypothetical protein